MTTKRNDLDPARASVWITFAWTVLAITLVCVLALLTACGGGIDTADEFMGPPVSIADVKPCPVNTSSCHPDPTN